MSIPMYLLRGLIIAQLWGWFIVPYFAGVPDLTVLMGVGISLFISLFTINTVGAKADFIADKELSKKEKWKFIITPIAGLLIVWGISWIFSFFMPTAIV